MMWKQCFNLVFNWIRWLLLAVLFLFSFLASSFIKNLLFVVYICFFFGQRPSDRIFVEGGESERETMNSNVKHKVELGSLLKLSLTEGDSHENPIAAAGTKATGWLVERETVIWFLSMLRTRSLLSWWISVAINSQQLEMGMVQLLWKDA